MNGNQADKNDGSRNGDDLDRDQDRDASSLETTQSDEKRKCGGSRGNDFVTRLHYLLRELEQEGNADIISWLPHGRAIKVHDRERLKKEILPNWFQQTKISSFYRQLNHYGFKRLVRGPDKNAYYHELFLKDQPELVQVMQRKKLKGTGHGPSLWAMSGMPPTPRPEHDVKVVNAVEQTSFGTAIPLVLSKVAASQPANTAPSIPMQNISQERSHTAGAPSRPESVTPLTPPSAAAIEHSTPPVLPPAAAVPPQIGPLQHMRSAFAGMPVLSAPPVGFGVPMYPQCNLYYPAFGGMIAVALPPPGLAIPMVPAAPAHVPHPLLAAAPAIAIAGEQHTARPPSRQNHQHLFPEEAMSRDGNDSVLPGSEAALTADVKPSHNHA